jgi:protein disulfide-isomerase
MKTVCAVLFACLTLACARLEAAEGNWSTDLGKVVAQAKTEKKMVLINFTGSDWCGWCIKLDKEVFSQPAFKDYAAKNLVLMEVDFPNKKKQSTDLKKANKELQKRYKIEGYPTLIVLNSEGKIAGELGYMPGGPKAFLGELDKLKKK